MKNVMLPHSGAYKAKSNLCCQKETLPERLSLPLLGGNAQDVVCRFIETAHYVLGAHHAGLLRKRSVRLRRVGVRAMEPTRGHWPA